jgi:hypothetical protein
LINGIVLFEDKGGKGRFISVLLPEEHASRYEKKSAAPAAN